MPTDNLQIFAVTAPGCESACVDELGALGLDPRPEPGGVTFEGALVDLYRANLWLRCASRILVRFAEFKTTAFPDLFRRCVRLPWGRYIKVATPVRVTVSCRRSRLMHTRRVAETVSAAVDRALGRREVPDSAFFQQVLVRFEDDRCTISVDASGELLHRRGYRQEQGRAPLRETLAAALVHTLGWRGEEPLWDLMCGSGTLPIEAAMIAGRCAPGYHRHFAFENWPRFRSGRWQLLREEARRNEQRAKTPIVYGGERDSSVLSRAVRNAERAGVGTFVRWLEGDFRLHAPPEASGVILCNPPYGERLEGNRSVRRLYADFGAYLKDRCRGWRGGFICPDPALAAATGLSLTARSPHFVNGGIEVCLYQFHL